MDYKLTDDIINDAKSFSDLAVSLFGKNNYTNRQKCKDILSENGIDWEEWRNSKKPTPNQCLYCGKEIANGEVFRKNFCDRSCAASYNNKKRKKKVNKCLCCGKEIKSKKFCSPECQTKYYYNIYIEKWKNGETNGVMGKYFVNSRIRNYLFDKYNNKCQICGWHEVNTTTGKIPLQIHHIDGDCTNNLESNLQLLCPNCHSLTNNYGNTNKKSKRIDKHNRISLTEV